VKALGIVSSPRAGGNSELAVKEILSRLPESWEKKMLRLNNLNIKYCKACYACIPVDKKCKLDDDLNFFLERVREADKIVIAAPAYFLGTHTAVKLVTDRLLSILNNFREFEGKDCVIAASYGRDKWEGAVKENMLIFAAQLHLRVVDSAVFLATIPGESVQGENLKALSRLAGSLLNPPAKPFSHEDELDCPFCGAAALAVLADGNWTCRICSGRGKIEYSDGKFSLKPDEVNLCHFTPEGKMRHAAYLDDRKNFFIENRHKVKEIQAKYANFNWWVKPEEIKQ
jgi:multimeric flavodoxin WrbA